MFVIMLLLGSIFPSFAQYSDVVSTYDHASAGMYEPPDPREKHFRKDRAELAFPGGVQALHTFIIEHLDYPEIAVENCIEGTVVAKISFDKNGNVRNACILRSLNEACDQAVINLAEKMPQWYPAIRNGRPVSESAILPVRFSLTWN